MEISSLNYAIILMILLPMLDRLGGWRYKYLRRYGIPLSVFVLNPSYLLAVHMGILCLVLSFNLDEIEERDWDDVLAH